MHFTLDQAGVPFLGHPVYGPEVSLQSHADECALASSGAYNEAIIFLGLIEYELNSLLGASHLVDYFSVHIRFDLERYLLISYVSLQINFKRARICNYRILRLGRTSSEFSI